MRKRWLILLAASELLFAPSGILSAAPGDMNALVVNQFNAVSGGKYLDNGQSDPRLGRVEGNGQNWLQLLTTKTDPGKNTINLQGYQIDWSYNKDASDYGSGVMTFSNDPVWAAVPLGTAITINEDKEVWYLNQTPPNPPNPDGDPVGAGGMQRNGDIDGLGVQHGSAYSGNPSLETLINFSSQTGWNPNGQAGANMQPGPNWNINVWAGQGPTGNVGNTYNFQYFSVSGTVVSGGASAKVGTDVGGLIAINNDNWQFTIKDSQGNVVEGPIGEALKSNNPPGWGGASVNAQDVGQVQAFAAGTNPTLADWQNIAPTDYGASASSRYGGPSQWTNPDTTTATEDLSPLRSWFANIRSGDVNLDGIVNGQDIATAASNWLHTGASVGLLQGDTNGDDIVNGEDIAAIAADWLHTGGAPAGGGGASVPEPSASVLCAIGILIGLLGLRRGRARWGASAPAAKALVTPTRIG